MGLCQVLYTDRGSYYTSSKFQEYLKARNITHVLPAPNCAFTVGQADSMVKELKQRLKLSLSPTKK